MSAASPAMPAGLPPDLAWRWHKRRLKQARREARAARWMAWGGHPLRGWRLPLMILGFVAWWPIGLALLAFFFLWRPVMACNAAPWTSRLREAMEARPWAAPPSTGNAAFD